MTELATWIGILFCVSQSAMFSGLNLAFFSISKMRLNIEVTHDNDAAKKVLQMREDSNFLLTTILWGNVGINVLLTLLSNSVMAGMTAFLFSTFIITLFGEITPQAYFSRNALKMASALAPVLKFYQFLLWPLAKPSAKILDLWLGKEAVQFFRETEIEELLRLHMKDETTDINRTEGKGALNFLAIDDLKVTQEGEEIDSNSIIALEFEGTQANFPSITYTVDDPFLRQIQRSNKPWIIITDMQERPRLVIDADNFIRASLFNSETFNPFEYCHRPMIITNMEVTLGNLLSGLHVQSEHTEDDVIDKDIILIWGEKRRIITGADILGRLLRGIAAK